MRAGSALRWAGIASVVAVLGLAGARAAPYLYAEYSARGPATELVPPPARPVRGRWFDDCHLVEALDEATFAIGEPRSDQGTYSSLILGSARALPFDAGTGKRNIVPVIRSLTRLPVTVVPSHLHFDHVDALGRFDRTTPFGAQLADVPPEITAPRLQVADLWALHAALTEIASGRARVQGFHPRIVPVRGTVRYGGAFPWNAR